MHIVILGNGISGVTCARFLRKYSNHDISLVSDESDAFFSRTALMYVFMGHMRLRDTVPYEDSFWEKNRIQRIWARIERIDFQKKTLYDTSGKGISYDKLVLSTGSKSHIFDWPGKELEGVQGLYHLQDLEAMERQARGLTQAVIVGGGLIGVEMAEMWHSRGVPVTFLVREKAFWSHVLPAEEAAMVNRHLREHHIDLRLGTELKAILPDASGQKCGAVLTQEDEKIDCGWVGLATGVRPNIDFLKNTPLETHRGILVDEYLQTNLADVYAAGDCVELRRHAAGRRAIEAVWYTGRMMGETVAHNLLQEKNPRAYEPGIWFNSAKFFDIEYQTYGNILPQLPDNQSTVYWEHPQGKKSIRINYDRDTLGVVGFNLMGVRYRQEVCEKWIRERTSIETVLQQLGLANFDPEFSAQHEADMVAAYNHISGKNLTLKQKRGLPRVLQFLQNA